MTTVFRHIEIVAPDNVLRVRDTEGREYVRYSAWLSPYMRRHAAPEPEETLEFLDRWVEDTDPDPDGDLHGARFGRLLEYVGEVTDVTSPDDTIRHWRTDRYPTDGWRRSWERP